jgi:hypothetical protein
MMKYKDFYSHLIEMAIPLGKARYFTDKSNKKYKQLFPNLFGTKHRIYIPFDASITEELLEFIIKQPASVTSYVRLSALLVNNAGNEEGHFTLSESDDGIDISTESFINYVNNTCYFYDSRKESIKKDKNGKNIPFKLGRVIQKYLPEQTELLKTFNSDPFRQIFGKELQIVISRHPYDIAGMSTDRNWSSCTDLGTERIVYKSKRSSPPAKGSNARFIEDEIRVGSLVAYLIMANDTNIQKPISRILIKPYKSTKSRGDIYYNVSGMYGVNIKKFETTVRDWVTKNINSNAKSGSYIKFGGYYDTGDERTPDEDVNLFGRPDEYLTHIRRDLKQDGVSIEHVHVSMDKEDHKDVAMGHVTYGLGKHGIFYLTEEKAEKLTKIFDSEYSSVLNDIEFDYDEDSMVLTVYFTLKFAHEDSMGREVDDYQEVEKFFSELKYLYRNITNKKYEI